MTRNNLIKNLLIASIVAAVIFVFFTSRLLAQIKNYNYERIDVSIKINSDSTFDVEEKQTFNFVGEYHDAWRSVTLSKTDGISDISVIDAETNQALVYSKNQLAKTDPASWGKFTHYRKNGVENIIWYYNLANIQHAWIVKYKVHGGITFGKEKDGLYWNIFTDYSQPINNSTVKVILPQLADQAAISTNAYRENNSLPIAKGYASENGTFFFESANFAPKEDFTIDIAWPKGIVSQSAYWFNFFKTYYGYISSIIIIIIAFLIGLFWWLFAEKLKESRQTIVPQYEPPEHLPPAMAEIIAKEKLTNKGLTATIVDLAVRGYLKIQEDPNKSKRGEIATILASTILVAMVGIMIAVFLPPLFKTASVSAPFVIFAILIFIFVAFFIFTAIKEMHKKTKSSDYILTKIKDTNNNPELHDYEKTYLEVLFEKKDIFSTKDMRKVSHQQEKKEFYMKIQKIKKGAYEEADSDTKAFETSISREQKIKPLWIILPFFVVFIALFIISRYPDYSQFISLSMTGLVAGFILVTFIKYDARLSKQGIILKNEWLGFKMYLEVAEKYRMQNLTPDLFEKYLPYAMIFGVEKQWAKVFEPMNIPQPNWYHSTSFIAAGGINDSSVGSFSPSAFSSSFSSSFSSAFSSAGGGAAGGGGGSAGGGGGGGGGGAS